MGRTSLVRLMIHVFVAARVVYTPVIWFRVGVVCWLYSSAIAFCAAFFFLFGRPDILWFVLGQGHQFKLNPKVIKFLSI